MNIYKSTAILLALFFMSCGSKNEPSSSPSTSTVSPTTNTQSSSIGPFLGSQQLDGYIQPPGNSFGIDQTLKFLPFKENTKDSIVFMRFQKDPGQIIKVASTISGKEIEHTFYKPDINNLRISIPVSAITSSTLTITNASNDSFTLDVIYDVQAPQLIPGSLNVLTPTVLKNEYAHIQFGAVDDEAGIRLGNANYANTENNIKSGDTILPGTYLKILRPNGIEHGVICKVETISNNGKRVISSAKLFVDPTFQVGIYKVTTIYRLMDRVGNGAASNIDLAPADQVSFEVK